MAGIEKLMRSFGNRVKHLISRGRGYYQYLGFLQDNPTDIMAYYDESDPDVPFLRETVFYGFQKTYGYGFRGKFEYLGLVLKPDGYIDLFFSNSGKTTIDQNLMMIPPGRLNILSDQREDPIGFMVSHGSRYLLLRKDFCSHLPRLWEKAHPPRHCCSSYSTEPLEYMISDSVHRMRGRGY